MLSILAWWAIPAIAALLAAVVLAISRRIRRTREEVGTLQRYQRARQVLARTQQPSTAPRRQPQPQTQPERTGLPTTE